MESIICSLPEETCLLVLQSLGIDQTTKNVSDMELQNYVHILNHPTIVSKFTTIKFVLKAILLYFQIIYLFNTEIFHIDSLNYSV
jgi:hypothetical protein